MKVAACGVCPIGKRISVEPNMVYAREGLAIKSIITPNS